MEHVSPNVSQYMEEEYSNTIDSTTSHRTSIFEILATKEFCQRLKVGRSTVFEWKRKGILRENIDYFQNSRVLRFLWSSDILKRISNAKQSERHDREPKPQKEDTQIISSGKPRRRSVVNLKY